MGKLYSLFVSKDIVLVPEVCSLAWVSLDVLLIKEEFIIQAPEQYPKVGEVTASRLNFKNGEE